MRRKKTLSIILGVEAEKNQALEHAIAVLGGITKFAAALDLNSHATAHQWRSNRVPAEQCPRIEALTRDVAREKVDPTLIVTCEELRPDVAWSVLRESQDAA